MSNPNKRKWVLDLRAVLREPRIEPTLRAFSWKRFTHEEYTLQIEFELAYKKIELVFTPNHGFHDYMAAVKDLERVMVDIELHYNPSFNDYSYATWQRARQMLCLEVETRLQVSN